MSSFKVKFTVEECDDLIGIIRSVIGNIPPEHGVVMQKLLKALISAEYIDLPSDEEILNHSFDED